MSPWTRRAVLASLAGLAALPGRAVATEPAPEPAPMPTLVVGDGPRRALLLHGNDLCGPFYVPLAEQLATRGFRTALPTLPGYDGTPALQPTTPRTLLDALVPLVGEHAAPDGILIGHSLGGLLAALLAVEPGVEIGGLVLLEPAIVPQRWLARRIARAYAHKSVDAPRDEILEDGGFYHRLHDPEHFPAEAMAIGLRCRKNSDTSVVRGLLGAYRELYPLPLERITVPTLVLRGASSGWPMKRGQKMVARRIEGAKKGVIDGAGHWMANENDAALAEAIAGLL